MSQKRHPEEGSKVESDANSPDEKRQKVPALRGVVMEALKVNRLQKFFSALEPLVRKVVKEEVELALAKHLASIKRQCGKQVYPSTPRSLQLLFMNKLSLPVFTGTRIEGEECSGINIAVVDTMTGQVAKSGPESLMKVEIVVLEGDFEGDEEDNWTYEEFKNNMVREREGKRSLLTGGVLLDLIEGTGVVGDLSFTDNSSWTRSRKFRLGARVEEGYFNGIRVREAKTEPFMVKDHRGELYKKHYPPSLFDEVWRLEKIGKDGAFHKRLSSANINTVKDFLTLLCTDALRLRNILGSGMSAKMWEVTVEHARTCILDNQMHIYYPNGQKKTGVIFNIVGEVMGILSEQQYISVKDLSDSEKADAFAHVKVAYEHWDDVISCDMGAISGISSHSPPSSFPSASHSLSDNIYSNFPSISSPDIGSSIFPMGCTRGLDAYALPAVNNMECRYEPESHSLLSHNAYKDPRELQKVSNSPLFDECGSHSFFGEDGLQFLDSDISLLSQSLGADSPADLGSAVTGFLAMSARSAAARKADTGWKMLISVLKWWFSIKRIVRKNRRK